MVTSVCGKSSKLLPPCRYRILKLKCIKFYFGWGSAPDPAGGAYSAPQTPYSWILRGLLLMAGQGRQGEEGKGRIRLREGDRREEKGLAFIVHRAPQCVNPVLQTDPMDGKNGVTTKLLIWKRYVHITIYAIKMNH
jgi:hypothetical protein